LACIGILDPEFLLGIAVGQRVSARNSVKVGLTSCTSVLVGSWCDALLTLDQKFKAAGHANWTLTHAFFADMGGFVLEAPDLAFPIPLDSDQLLYLIQHDHVEAPRTPIEDIKDKSKTDRLARYGLNS